MNHYPYSKWKVALALIPMLILLSINGLALLIKGGIEWLNQACDMISWIVDEAAMWIQKLCRKEKTK